MFISTVPIISYLYMFIKFYISIFSDVVYFYSNMLFYFSILSIALGTFGALVQKKVKKLIAYSSISSIGYILTGVSSNTVLLLQHSFMFLFIYIFNVLPVFIFLLNYSKQDAHNVNISRSFSGLFIQNKLLFTLYASFFFSLAGIPIFSGFFSKAYLLSGLCEEHYFFLLSICILGTVLSCYYYVKVIKIIYYDYLPSKTIVISKPEYFTFFTISMFFLFNIFFLFIFS